MPASGSSGPADRDRSVRRVRAAGWLLAFTAVGAATGLSVAASHAFKGRQAAAVAAPAVHRVQAARRTRVPAPQHVPAIAGQVAPLSPPAQPPAPAQPAPESDAPVSGGS